MKGKKIKQKLNANNTFRWKPVKYKSYHESIIVGQMIIQRKSRICRPQFPPSNQKSIRKMHNFKWKKKRGKKDGKRELQHVSFHNFVY